MQRLVAIQVAISLASALFLTWFGLVRIGIVSEPKWMSSATPMKIPGYGYILDSAMSKKNLFGTFLLGAIFGFLPCGLSYAAFARALTAGGVVRGALWVLAFGLGTVPGLLLIGTAASRFARRHARHFDILSGMLMIAMGVSVVARTI